ncbi:WXG100 family type VII secretion target [Nocardioides sp. Y6]|uniref:ESAT-6-like protein n=1 Tax=Nocardioides malaquae TaxID=2773426 RepID=A0ABR9RR54_9ACTN|nr:WXG100 family type VII secretion target [Nocardioides malaquae]MBE7324049.1 WXG100 family type VII secretion target [Nocardioides malaquae]
MNQMAPAGGLVAEEGVLAAASETVLRARVDVLSLSSKLETEITELGASWSGEGARAFAQLHRTWQDKQRRVVGALDNLAAALDETGRDTSATDAAQADVSRLLVSRLG